MPAQSVHLQCNRTRQSSSMMSGQNTWKKSMKGLPTNYGWPLCEGACSPPDPDFENPIHQYSHADGCAIVGAFYNPVRSVSPEYNGVYFSPTYAVGGLESSTRQTAIRSRLSPPGRQSSRPAGERGWLACTTGSGTQLGLSGALYQCSQHNQHRGSDRGGGHR
jgi:hypothetical protein